MVWPWKKTIYSQDATGEFLLDSNGEKIIENYTRYLPELHNNETWLALGFVIFGIFIVLALDWYGQRTRK